MFLHSFKNTLKTLIRQRQLVFWALLFPLVLGLLFKLALGNIDEKGKYKAIPVSVSKTVMDQPYTAKFIKTMEADDYLIVSESTDTKLLENGDVRAHIESIDKVITNGNGIEETIVEYMMNSYLRNESTVKRLIAEKPQMDFAKVLEVDEFIDDQTNPNMNMVNTYFYTLIGMQAMYGYMWGMEVMYQYEANLSTNAKRISVSPLNKKIALISSLLVAWIINILVVFVNIAFCNYLLGIDFGGQTGPIFGLVSLGALTGVAFGAFIAVSNKKEQEFKAGLGISITMLLSFLAGMMVSQIKVIIQKNAPLINKLNPVALITDGFYSIYYYGSLDRYYTNILWLALITIALMALTFLFVRGKTYDSL